MAWALTRCLPDVVSQQSAGVWQQDFRWLPFPRQALVLGLGSIGRSLVERLKADGIRTIGVRRRDSGPIEACDCVCRGSSWRRVLPQIDWCFLALPNTRETTGLFDEAAIAALPAHALVVNVGRANCIDTAALCRALRDGALGGAALDVVPSSPLAADDPLWHTPRLLMTPHVAAHYAERGAEVERFCESQVRRYISGEPLLDRVDLNEVVQCAAA
jgi:phosphoglycerate dehydrogenase-like enzyme